MDPLDILTDLEHVIPYFQPIFSADEHQVAGYEVLGRFKKGDQEISLGPFFQDLSIPDEYRIEVDDAVLNKALEKSLSLDNDVLLFINKDATLLLHEDEEKLLNQLRYYEDLGLGLNRIVIEISIKNYEGKFDPLVYLLNYYRTFGIKIAFDKLSIESSNLDIISQLSPDIMKVDLSALRSTNSASSFEDIVYSFSLLARKVGARLLFENIEMDYQLHFAWKNGGSYYQGYYLSRPSENFVEKTILKEKLKKECQYFINAEKMKLEELYEITSRLNKEISSFIRSFESIEPYEKFLEALGKKMDEMAFRLYICDEDGFQKSPNLFRKDGGWVIQEEYRNKNWSWRPYFLENILKMRKEKKGILSDLYSDLETGELIRTFSVPLGGKYFLFIDISYEYLFEHPALL